MAYIYNVMHDEGFQKKILNDDGTLNEETIAQIYRYCQDTLQEVNTLNNRLDKKVNIAQGAQNSGKYLLVGTDGNVTTATLPMPTIPIYGIAEVATTEGYLKTYQLYSVADGKTTYHDTKINIPRDFFLRNVELLDVTESSPLAGYEIGKYFKFTFVVDGGAERIQILPIDTLRPCTLTAGDHIHIEGEVAEAHSFVPQYDDVSKVLPHEKIFQYTGDTNSDFHHGYFYERGEGGMIPAGSSVSNVEFYSNVTDYTEIHPFLSGEWYDTGKKGETFYVYSGNTSALALHEITEVGDTLWVNGSGNCEVVAINDGRLTIRLPNGNIMPTKFSLYGTNPVRESEIYTNGTSVLHIVRRTNMETGFIEDCIYAPTNTFANGEHFTELLANWHSVTLDHDVTYGSIGWHQLNVQPQGIPAELEVKIHDQNTDTMLASGKVKVESNKISATLPIVSSGDIQGTDTTTNTTHLLSKKLNADMLRMYSSWSAMESDKSNIPNGAWVAITEY